MDTVDTTGNTEDLSTITPQYIPPLPRTRILPVTKADLLRMIDACDPDTLAGARDRFLFALTWVCAYGRARVSSLDVRHLTDGTVDLSPNPAVQALGRAWLAARKTAKVEDLGMPPSQIRLTGPLFVRVDRYGHLYRGGVRLQPDGVNDAVQRAVHAAHLPHAERYSADSLRLGGTYGR